MVETQYYLKMCWLKKYPEKASRIAKSLREKMGELGGESCQNVPLSLLPLLMDKRDLEAAETSAKLIYSAIQKTISASFSSPQIKKYFPHEAFPKEWLQKDPGYAEHSIITRLDVLFDGKNLKYIEFNTDNPGGQALSDISRRMIGEHPFYRTLIDSNDKSIAESIAEKEIVALKSAYRQFRPKNTESPVVALVASKNELNTVQVKWTAAAYQRKGVRTVVAAPEDFRFKSGKVFVGEKQIDLVRRCLKAQELLNQPSKVTAFLEGYLSNSYCMVNSIRAVYGSEKSILALMALPEFHHLYNKEEIAAITRYIPWTRQLSDLNTTSPGGKSITLVDFLKKYRKRMVLKPCWGYLGKDVYLGMNTEKEQWEKLIDERMGNKEWIAQEYIDVPQMPVVFYENDKVVVRKNYFNLGFYVIDGQFAGIFGRTSSNPMINIENGALLPVLNY